MAKPGLRIDVKSWRGKLAADEGRRAGEKGVYLAGEYLLENANRTAPFDTGVMVGTGSVQPSGPAPEVNVGYDTPYAVRQHEELTYQHAPGRRAKWLEKALQEEEKAIIDIVAREVERAFS